MEFDISTMDRVCRDKANVDIFKSKYLGENVPYIHYFEDGDLYFVPVDGKRIYDPLFNTGWHVVGTIVGVHLKSKPNRIYQSKNNDDRIDNAEKVLFNEIGKPIIAPAKLNTPHDVYHDGVNVYYVWWLYLVRVDYMILTDPQSVVKNQYGDIYRFLTGDGNEKIWEEIIKPNLSEKPLLPMLIENARTEVHQHAEKLKNEERDAEYANKVYTELCNIMEEMKDKTK